MQSDDDTWRTEHVEFYQRKSSWMRAGHPPGWSSFGKVLCTRRLLSLVLVVDMECSRGNVRVCEGVDYDV